MHTGTVSALKLDLGYGFIARPNGSDLFFHARDLGDALEFNEQLLERRVAFEVITTPKGARAAGVMPAEN